MTPTGVDYRRSVVPGAVSAVVGCGTMGRGIAQLLAQAGMRVRLFDAQSGAAAAARQTIANDLDRLAAKGKLTRDAAAEVDARLEPMAALPELVDATLVVEAIAEDLAAKRRLFAEIEALVSPQTILATNTSSLSVTAIAAGCRMPERVAGFHFFNPAPVMKLVEVVAAIKTDPAVADALIDLARRFGHSAVRTRDTPGFVINHAGRGYVTEGLKILAEGVCDPPVLDAVLRDACGFKLGPCELLDLTGLDVSHPVMESIYHQFYEDPRYRPQVLTRVMVDGGLLGRKSGAGFYCYDEGRRRPSIRPSRPTVVPPRVWIHLAAPARGAGVRAALAPGVTVDIGERPEPDSLIVVTPLGRDTTETVIAAGLDPRRAVAFDALFPGREVRCLFANPAFDPAWRAPALAAFSSEGVDAHLVRDSTGLIVQRVLAHVVNIACSIAEQRIADPHDIDVAVKLGLAYPQGPLAWGDAIGASTVRDILAAMLAATGDARYRPTAWLARRAALGLPLKQLD
jgi:3-hydroxybutyryl-CoA dehydrogenase